MELNNNIGITSPGDMGQGVAMCIKALGFNVCMASDRRSARTRALGERSNEGDVIGGHGSGSLNQTGRRAKCVFGAERSRER